LQQVVYLHLQQALLLPHPVVAHRFVLRRIGLELGAVHRNVSQRDQAGVLTQPKHLDEQLAECRQMLLAEITDGSEVRRGFAANTRNAMSSCRRRAICREAGTPTA
jgi:hypothetical protein